MPLEMQVKLLRVLQDRKVRPVGGDSEVEVKARIVTATNRDLELEVAENRFREDLFYRINVVAIAVPPLRARPDDGMELAQRFLIRAAQAHQQARARLPRRRCAEADGLRLARDVRELEKASSARSRSARSTRSQ